jgi:thiamine-monophosphate kinase
MDERARIALLGRVLAADSRGRGVDVAIGDDAAVLDPAGAGRLVWTIDEQVDGVHFRRDLVSFRDVGWRSFMAAASDLAAMGAEPWCALSALVLPDDVDDAGLEALASGQAAAAAAAGAPVVGGNLSRGPALSVATSFLGRCERAVARTGARPGDGVWLAGPVGRAAAGFRALLRGPGLADHPALADAVGAWRRPSALLAEGRGMGAHASAAVDVSDGLARDVGHLAAASGVRVVLDEAALRADPVLTAAAAELGDDPLELALRGGEDYALVAAAPVAIAAFRRIGEVREGTGVALRRLDGREETLSEEGFDHFVRPVAGSR